MSEWLGLELQRIRKEQELTVEGLAEKNGVSASTIRGVEPGITPPRSRTSP